MAAMTSAQIAQELQRKRAANILPTDKSNLGAYNALKPTTPQANPLQPKPTPKVNEGYSGVRSFFEGNGYKDVGWNPNNKMVTVGGMDALSPTQNIGGTTYASGSDLNGALSRIQGMETNKKTNSILSQLEERMNQKQEIPQFNYDPTTDPAYQSALARAQANATTASGNAMAELNRRGILNSTITSDRTAQIQQGEMGRVSSEILPQLMQQAYGRHRDSVGDQMTQERNSIADLGNLLGITNDLGQQRTDNQYRDNTFNRGVLENDRNFDRGVMEDDRNYDRGVLESDRGYDRNVLESNRDYNLSSSRESRIASGGGSSGGSSGSSAKPTNLNTVIDNINPRFTKIDKDSGERVVTDVKAVQQYIDSLGLNESERQQMYNYYGIGSSGGGSANAWDTVKSVFGALKDGAAAVNKSTVSDDDINKYLK